MAKYKVKVRDCQLIVRVKLSLREKLDERLLTLFLEKKIRGLLRARPLNKNSIEYSGPIGISLYERLKKPMSKYDFLFIMEQIVDVFQKLDVNFLTAYHVVLDVRYVFINETTKEVQFIYLPLVQAKEDIKILTFMESIIYSVTSVQEEDMDYISRFVYFIRDLKKYDGEKIEKYIMGEDMRVVSIIKRHNVGQSGFITDKRADYYTHYGEKDSKTTRFLYEEETTRLLENEETMKLLVEDEATRPLSEEACIVASLCRLQTKEIISINKPVFRIGKESKCSDYVVWDNDKVSRSHAEIITRGRRYFVMDLNSSNRTFINEEPIPAHQEVEIFSGNHLKFANEEFEFRT